MAYTVRVTDKFGTRDIYTGLDSELALDIAWAINRAGLRTHGWDDLAVSVSGEKGE